MRPILLSGSEELAFDVQLETSVERHLAELDRAGRNSQLAPEERVEHLTEKIARSERR